VYRHLYEPRAANGVLDYAQAAMRRERVARIGIEAGIKRYVVVRGVEAGMIEDVEELRIVPQRESLRELG
jgi:hypothetical protein